MSFSASKLGKPENMGLDENLRYTASPATDVLETPDEYVITSVMPGLNKDDIHMKTVPGELLLQAAARLDPPQGMYVHCLEFCSVLYRLRLPLPPDAILDELSAVYGDGVLTLRLPRKKQSLVRRINVTSG